MQPLSKLFLILALITTSVLSHGQDKYAALAPYEGTWALTLPHNGFNDAGWLEVKKMDDHIYASILWYGGSVVPVQHASLSGNDLVLHMVHNRNNVSVVSTFKIHKERDEIVGTRYSPSTDGSATRRESFRGKKLPADPARPNLAALKYGEPIHLIQDNNLNGWRIIGDRANGWSVKNGILLNDPVQPDHDHHIRYGNLRTKQVFNDFNLKLEVNVPKGNNSGVYLKGIYEIQVVDSYGKDVDSHHMGALYSRITPSEAAEKPAGEWQTMDITLVDRHVTVILNGKTIIDNQPVRGVTGGAMTSDEFHPGPIYLQGDHGKVQYRNIVLTPIVK